jgi:hypothetical protein
MNLARVDGRVERSLLLLLLLNLAKLAGHVVQKHFATSLSISLASFISFVSFDCANQAILSDKGRPSYRHTMLGDAQRGKR